MYNCWVRLKWVKIIDLKNITYNWLNICSFCEVNIFTFTLCTAFFLTVLLTDLLNHFLMILFNNIFCSWSDFEMIAYLDIYCWRYLIRSRYFSRALRDFENFSHVITSSFFTAVIRLRVLTFWSKSFTEK